MAAVAQVSTPLSLYINCSATIWRPYQFFDAKISHHRLGKPTAKLPPSCQRHRSLLSDLFCFRPVPTAKTRQSYQALAPWLSNHAFTVTPVENGNKVDSTHAFLGALVSPGYVLIYPTMTKHAAHSLQHLFLFTDPTTCGFRVVHSIGLVFTTVPNPR